MPTNKYLNIIIDNQKADIDISEAFPISIDYQLEDNNDFQKKKSSEALNIKIPATPKNDEIYNTFHNPSVDDNSPDGSYRGVRSILIEANGHEILCGKNMLNKVTRQFGKPKEYEVSAFGNNADWMIDLKEATLFDFLKHISFPFTNSTVEGSWNFNGQNEFLPYVFAPVKYASFMDTAGATDENYALVSMKPSLSKYFLIYWAFKSLGYRIESEFLNTNFYRRMVMPWTWGAFLSSEGTKYEVHNFLAAGLSRQYRSGSQSEYWNLLASNDNTGVAFDNNTVNHPDPEGGDYTWHPENDYEMRWTYNTPHYGTLEAGFSITLDIDAGCNGGTAELHLTVEWSKNNTLISTSSVSHLDGPLAGGASDLGFKTVFFNSIVNPDDRISARVHLYMYSPKLGYASCGATLVEFKTDYFKIPIGGTISFDSYLGLQKYKFLDFLRGEADLWNLAFQTDSINKVVVIEPVHEYSLTTDLAQKQGGYFKNDYIDWSDKCDLSKESTVELYKDSERELLFKFREDGSDGAYKLVKDRNIADPGTGKYVFPERFKSGKREIENRFFSPTMHYEVSSFKNVTGVAPQMICLVPENISNTSSGEAGNTFLPKSAYYKGFVHGFGGWIFNHVAYTGYPFMFAVNYKVGGENDPILSYCDEKIGEAGSQVLGVGLLKRFYWQRLAIMRNGQYLVDNLNLVNNDITNWFHRERKRIDGNLWELMTIKAYKPLSDDSTQCFLRKFSPITEKDQEQTYPSISSVTDGTVDGTSYDMKYTKLVCLSTDIPTPTE